MPTRFYKIPLQGWLWLRARVELAVLASIGLGAAALLGFVLLMDQVIEGRTHSFDESLLRALRSPTDLADPIGPWWIELMMQDLTAVGGTTVLTLITAAVIGYLLIDRKRAAALLVLVSIGGGVLLSSLAKNLVARPRPELVAHMVEVRTLSFPSGHAMMSAVTFLTLGALLARVQPRRRLKIYLLSIAIILTVLVGASRVYLGVHWPTDVLAGWCAGAFWAILCWTVALWLQARGQVERDTGQVSPPDTQDKLTKR
jgi:undecaprenyl-diphosphatase